MPKKSSSKNKAALSSDDGKKAAKALEVLFTTDYISKRQLYLQNFLRGIFFSAGTIIGAAIIVVVSVWLLSLFNQIPIIGPAFDELKQSIENTSSQ